CRYFLAGKHSEGFFTITVIKAFGIRIDNCRFPNLANDETSFEANAAYATFEPLIASNCSSQLKFFLCSVYFPMCTDKVPNAIGPCRPLCEHVRLRCIPLLEQIGFPWPLIMNCDNFPPENNQDSMCMKGPPTDEPDESDVKLPLLHINQCSQTKHVYMNRTGKCIPLCNSTQGRKLLQEDRDYATTALFVMSTICVVLTLLCILLYCPRRRCLDTLPEISLFFCTASFAVSSVVYLVSLHYQDQVTIPVSCMEYANKLVFVVTGLQHMPCTIAAILLYYFGTTGRLWWFILCCTWNKFTLKREQDTVNDTFLLHAHMFAWGAPLAIIIIALMAQSVHADPLSGLCLVGGGNRIIETIFVSLREIIMLLSSSIRQNLFQKCSIIWLTIKHLGSTATGDHSVALSGLLGSLYPITAAFLLLSSLQYLLTPTLTGWNSVMAIKLVADPLLGIISATGCLFQIIFKILHSSRSPNLSKQGYQAAIPQLHLQLSPPFLR
uniref:Frizzled-4 n=1 Tax=Syphacia muris TaxID=451379 RepID=A0A0N5AF24_9BILA